MDVIPLLAVLIAVGFVVGLLSGLLGIGGGMIMVPVFRLAFGLEAIESTATSLFTIIPTSISGAISHIRNKTCLLALGLATGIGGALTSPLGVYLSTVSPDILVMLAAALVIGYSAISMFRKAARASRTGASQQAPGELAASGGFGTAGVPVAGVPAAGKGAPAAGKDAPAAGEGTPAAEAEGEAADPPLTRRNLAAAFCVGLLAGLASGYVGVGGGFLIVPLLISLTGLAMRKASGTSLIAVMILAIPGAVEQGILGHIDYVVGLAVAVGSIPGAVVGAKLIKQVPERQLRVLFGFVLIIAAILLVVKEVDALG